MTSRRPSNHYMATALCLMIEGMVVFLCGTTRHDVGLQVFGFVVELLACIAVVRGL